MRDNCSNKKMLDLIEACPNLIDVLRKKNMPKLIDAYDSLFGEFGMSFGTIPPYDKRACWGYYFVIDGEKKEVNSGVNLKSKAEAQLAIVYDTRYILENRIKTTDKPVHRG